MEYILIALLFINLIFTLIIMLRGNNDQTERMGRLETNIIKEFGDFKSNLTRELNEDFIKLNERI